MSDQEAAALERCELHDVQNCGLCSPPPQQYRHGPNVAGPPGAYVSVRGGKGVYHHPDCYNVTGDWDGADTATMGERVIHTAADLVGSELRPAACCQPPLF